MKKLLLALLCALPLCAMQNNQESKLHQHTRNGALAVVLANNAIIAGVTKGGCTLLGPVFLGGALAVMGTKYAYDKYKGN